MDGQPKGYFVVNDAKTFEFNEDAILPFFLCGSQNFGLCFLYDLFVNCYPVVLLEKQRLCKIPITQQEP